MIVGLESKPLSFINLKKNPVEALWRSKISTAMGVLAAGLVPVDADGDVAESFDGATCICCCTSWWDDALPLLRLRVLPLILGGVLSIRTVDWQSAGSTSIEKQNQGKICFIPKIDRPDRNLMNRMWQCFIFLKVVEKKSEQGDKTMKREADVISNDLINFYAIFGSISSIVWMSAEFVLVLTS